MENIFGSFRKNFKIPKEVFFIQYTLKINFSTQQVFFFVHLCNDVPKKDSQLALVYVLSGRRDLGLKSHLSKDGKQGSNLRPLDHGDHPSNGLAVE